MRSSRHAPTASCDVILAKTTQRRDAPKPRPDRILTRFTARQNAGQVRCCNARPVIPLLKPLDADAGVAAEFDVKALHRKPDDRPDESEYGVRSRHPPGFE